MCSSQIVKHLSAFGEPENKLVVSKIESIGSFDKTQDKSNHILPALSLSKDKGKRNFLIIKILKYTWVNKKVLQIFWS